MSFRICSLCQQHYLIDSSCPHCPTHTPSKGRSIALGALLGMAMIGCGDKEDTGEDPIPEPSTENDYGVGEMPPEETGEQ